MASRCRGGRQSQRRCCHFDRQTEFNEVTESEVDAHTRPKANAWTSFAAMGNVRNQIAAAGAHHRRRRVRAGAEWADRATKTIVEGTGRHGRRAGRAAGRLTRRWRSTAATRPRSSPISTPTSGWRAEELQRMVGGDRRCQCQGRYQPDLRRNVAIAGYRRLDASEGAVRATTRRPDGRRPEDRRRRRREDSDGQRGQGGPRWQEGGRANWWI